MATTYKFQSKASGDVLMVGSAGEAVLRAMGLTPAAKGIVEVAAMPGAVRALEAALAADEAARAIAQPLPTRAEADADAGDAEHEGQAVTLRQRAWPLLDMLRRSQAEGVPIVWGV